MKKRYAAIVIAIIVALAGWLFIKTSGQQQKSVVTPQAQTTQPEGEVAVEVRMKDDNYEPTEVNIKTGQAVRFVNASSGRRWPASNIHPTHELYPEFDPKKELQPGESWTFTFRETGSWRMHDHLFPYMKGKITVE